MIQNRGWQMYGWQIYAHHAETCELKSLDGSVKLFNSYHILNVIIDCFYLDIEYI